MRSRCRSKVAVGVLAASILVVAASCSIPLGDLGGPSSTALGINAGGVIVGVSEVPGSTPENRVEHAFKRLPDGTIVELASPPGSSSTAAVGINDSGQVAGMATIPGATPAEATVHALRWDADGTIHDLGFIGNANASVRAIDAQGRIIGFNDLPTGTSKAFVFDPAVGHMVDLPDLPDGQDSLAFGMNDEGEVVGYQWIGVPSLSVVPVRWDLDAWTATDLSTTWGRAVLTDINDAGTVVGQARFAGASPGTSTVEAAIVRPGETEPTALGAGPWSFPLSINDDEIVAGWSTDGADPDRAFRWESSTGIVRLTTDGDSYAWGINDRGQIVGQDDGRAALFVVPAPAP